MQFILCQSLRWGATSPSRIQPSKQSQSCVLLHHPCSRAVLCTTCFCRGVASSKPVPKYQNNTTKFTNRNKKRNRFLGGSLGCLKITCDYVIVQVACTGGQTTKIVLILDGLNCLNVKKSFWVILGSIDRLLLCTLDLSYWSQNLSIIQSKTKKHVYTVTAVTNQF